jgi:hypothetical protein
VTVLFAVTAEQQRSEVRLHNFPIQSSPQLQNICFHWDVRAVAVDMRQLKLNIFCLLMDSKTFLPDNVCLEVDEQQRNKMAVCSALFESFFTIAFQHAV